MKYLFGIEGRMLPLNESNLGHYTNTFNNIRVTITGGIIKVEFNQQEDFEEGKNLGHDVLLAYAFERNTSLSIDWFSSWKPSQKGGRDINLEIKEAVFATDFFDATIVKTHHQKGVARIEKDFQAVKSYDSIGEKVSKMRSNSTLKQVMEYYNNEVVRDDMPLYGTYKAIECIASHLGSDTTKPKLEVGYSKLADLAEKPLRFVKDLQETAQHQRHSATNCRMHFDNQEAKVRARFLIDCFTKSVI